MSTTTEGILRHLSQGCFVREQGGVTARTGHLNIVGLLQLDGGRIPRAVSSDWPEGCRQHDQSPVAYLPKRCTTPLQRLMPV